MAYFVKQVPKDLQDAFDVANASIFTAREMVKNMIDAATSTGGISRSITVRLMDALGPFEPGSPADSQALALALVYSESPLTEITRKQAANVGKVFPKALMMTDLVVQAALAEQQNRDHSLRKGDRFDPIMLEKSLNDWIFSGAHRPGFEDSPLCSIAKTIDLKAGNVRQAFEARFGCVVPVVVSLCVLRTLYESPSLVSKAVEVGVDIELSPSHPFNQ